jgi:hypothetical protein
MLMLDEVIKKQNAYLCSIGGVSALHEADEEYNEMNRKLITAFREHHGKAYLGNINFYDAERTAVINGEKSVYEEYTGQQIYNFQYAFCVPIQDKELEKIIRLWNGAGSSSNNVEVGAIINKIEAVGGINLIWC